MGTLDDIDAIHRLKARYFRMLDTREWDRLVQVFTGEITVDIAGSGGPATTTAVAFVDRVRSKLAGATTVHHGHQPEIDLLSASSATGVWAMEDRIWWPEGSPIRFLHGYGHYHETYHRTDAGWRIATMQLTRLHQDIEPASTEP